MKKVGVALLGLGVVGGGTYEILTSKKQYFKDTQGLDITVENVLERDVNKAIALGVDKDKVTTNMAEIVSNPNVDIVAEFIGGVEPAKSFMLMALKAGKSVVTANKELFCKHWEELEETAKTHNAGLYFEASCVGGVPIIRTLTEGMQGNEIKSIVGIINGTTNYILTKMCDEGESYGDVLAEAQKLGYAEADPTADVDGFDSTYKLSILSSLCFNQHITFDDIYREGISSISAEDIKLGKELGYTIKLLAIGKNRDKGIEVRVHPAFIKVDHPLANVKDSFNAVMIDGDNVGEVMLYGRGAGALPTGSAIVSDIVFASQQAKPKHFHFIDKNAKPTHKILNDYVTDFFLRISVDDKAGILSKVTNIFAKNNISVSAVMQKKLEKNGKLNIIFTTHKTQEKDMQKAVEHIEALPDVCKIESLIRVQK